MTCGRQATTIPQYKRLAYMWVAMNHGRSYRIMSPRQQETFMRPWHLISSSLSLSACINFPLNNSWSFLSEIIVLKHRFEKTDKHLIQNESSEHSSARLLEDESCDEEHWFIQSCCEKNVFVKCAVHLVISALIYLHMWLKWCVCVCVRSLHTEWSSFLQERKSKTGRLQIRREMDWKPASDTSPLSFYSLHPSIILCPRIFTNHQYAIPEGSFLCFYVLLSLIKPPNILCVPGMFMSFN